MKYHYGVYQNTKMVGVFESLSAAKEFVESLKSKINDNVDKDFEDVTTHWMKHCIEKQPDNFAWGAEWNKVCTAYEKIRGKPKFKITKITVFENVGEALT